jgi:hypothetical protein
MARTHAAVLAIPLTSVAVLLLACASDSKGDAEPLQSDTPAGSTAPPVDLGTTPPPGSSTNPLTAEPTPTTATTPPTPGPGTGGTGPVSMGGTASGGASTEGTSTSGGEASTGGSTNGSPLGTGGTSAGGTSSSGGMSGAATGGGGASGGTGGRTDGGAQAGSQSGGTSGGGAVSPSACVGDVWPSADPSSAGPFEVAADKGVGPLAGVVPDPIYGDEQQRYNVYRPANLMQSGYCHPILIWANGYTDNPEPNPPECIVDSGANRWCGQYLPLMNHLASHGFVVVASLSTITAEGDPLPTIAGLDWILEQAEDPSSPYYQRLDTNNIGQLGHSYGGMSTCMSASEPRYKALATICGTRALSGVHTPMLFFCGGRDATVDCSGVRETFLSVTDQPAFFLNELDSDHGSWVYQGANGVSLSSSAAWFRAHLMGDTESREYFYGSGCRFCTDNRVDAEQNSLMNE